MALCRGLAALCLFVAGCAGTPRSVVRVVDGREVEGRYIPPEAYALYLQGAYHERRNEDDLAARAYRSALAIDPESIEIRIRAEAVQCRHDRVPAALAFRSALALDAEYPPLLREIAGCLLEQGKAQEALTTARRALQIAPRDEESTRVVVEVLRRLGRHGEATALEDAFERFFPSSPSEAVIAVENEKPPRPGSDVAALDHAIARGDLSVARSAAVRSRILPADLAVRAAERGRPKLALEQAKLVLRAEPDNADAWIAAVTAADLVHDEADLRALLSEVPRGSEELGEAAISLFTELLRRRCGDEAGHAFRRATAQ